MRNIKFIYLKITLLLAFVFSVTVSCERNPSDEVEFATFPNNGDVFIDGFSGGLNYFPFDGSYVDAFTVDTDTKYKGAASMRFDVPSPDDPLTIGTYAGATFPLDSPRDLSGFDALTFWAKATVATNINEIGFGVIAGDKYKTTVQSLKLSTNWRKYIVPIPDPSKLTAEKGMFWYGESKPDGYTFWIDELKFEKLGTIGQPSPIILNGEDVVSTSFVGTNFVIDGLTQTFNLGSGLNQTVVAAPSYYTFSSSDVDVLQVSELGIVTVVGNGTATVTATIAGVKAKGSLTIQALGQFTFAPTPTLPASDVISLFSDAYTNRPVDFYNGYYEPYQTTTSNDFQINGDHILNYENYNFVGIEFNKNVPTIDASEMTTMHVDIFIPNSFDPASTIRINLVNFGADGAFGGGDDTSVSKVLSTTTTPALVTGQWISVEFDITGLTNRSKLGQIVFDADGDTTPRPSSFYVDNLYFHK